MIQRTACLIARGDDPYRNLALEKHLMDTLPDSTAILLLYQNRQSVVVGARQNPRFECDVDGFLASGGCIARRLSGGGVQYSDDGTLCYSIILPKRELNITNQLSILLQVLHHFALPVDPIVNPSLRSGGLVFSQNTFYKFGSSALHQGCIHVSTSKEAIDRFLTKDFEQPAYSVRYPQIVNLAQLNPDITMHQVQHTLFRCFSSFYRSEPTWLDERLMDQRSLDNTAAQFRDENWIFPADIEFDFSVSERFPWGNVLVLLRQESGLIRDARIYSDAVESALFHSIQQSLVGCPFLIGAIANRFQQKLDLVRDPRLLQIAGDVCTLISGRIRAQDRAGNQDG